VIATMHGAELVSMHLPDRCESVRGRCGKNLLFFTLRETHTDQTLRAYCHPTVPTQNPLGATAPRSAPPTVSGRPKNYQLPYRNDYREVAARPRQRSGVSLVEAVRAR
jgi:hypothetical protein